MKMYTEDVATTGVEGLVRGPDVGHVAELATVAELFDFPVPGIAAAAMPEPFALGGLPPPHGLKIQ